MIFICEKNYKYLYHINWSFSVRLIQDALPIAWKVLIIQSHLATVSWRCRPARPWQPATQDCWGWRTPARTAPWGRSPPCPTLSRWSRWTDPEKILQALLEEATGPRRIQVWGGTRLASLLSSFVQGEHNRAFKKYGEMLLINVG